MQALPDDVDAADASGGNDPRRHSPLLAIGGMGAGIGANPRLRLTRDGVAPHDALRDLLPHRSLGRLLR